MSNGIKIVDLQVDSIPTFLKNNKEKLINMDLSLDRYEISKSLTISLNRILIGNKTKLEDIYDYVMNNFEETSKKIKTIEDKINDFNSEQKFEYFVDPEKILYIVFFKQIIYIKKLITEIYNYIESNINLVYIYSYLISRLYNEPNNISSNYIFIINKMLSNTSILSNYDERIKKFISPEIIEKIFLIIKIIFSSDCDFIKLLTDLENKKMDEYKKNNSIDYSGSYKKKELELNIKTTIIGGNISDIENNFQKTRDFLFIQKRKINISVLYSSDNFNLIFKNGISIELWFGYNLFIYKRFDYNFDEYQTKINEILKSKGYAQIYLLGLDYLKDINTPDAGILPIIGGSNYMDKHINYYTKYIKYKNKFLKLKKFEK